MSHRDPFTWLLLAYSQSCTLYHGLCSMLYALWYEAIKKHFNHLQAMNVSTRRCISFAQLTYECDAFCTRNFHIHFRLFSHSLVECLFNEFKYISQIRPTVSVRYVCSTRDGNLLRHRFISNRVVSRCIRSLFISPTVRRRSTIQHRIEMKK